MPSGKFHDNVANQVFGEIPSDLNSDIDASVKEDGLNHRMTGGHNEEEVKKIAEKYKDKYPPSQNPLALYMAKLHVACDYCPLRYVAEKVPKTQQPLVDYLNGVVSKLERTLQVKDSMIESLRQQILFLSAELSSSTQCIQDAIQIMGGDSGDGRT